MTTSPSEFSGITLLYLDSKIRAGRVIIITSLLFLAFLTFLVAAQKNVIEGLREGDLVVCPEDAIAKMIENGRVTCIMRRIGHADLTYPLAPGWIDRVPRKSNRKKK